MNRSGSAEGGEHDRAGDRVVGGYREGVAGAVVEPGQDLAVGAVQQPVVGEVGLPALVRLLGLEPQVAALRAFGGFRGDRAGPDQDPVDGRSGQRRGVVVGQVPADRVGTGVQTRLAELLAQP